MTTVAGAMKLSDLKPGTLERYGLQGYALIEETRDFRGGSLEGNYLDSRLAKELERLLNKGEMI